MLSDVIKTAEGRARYLATPFGPHLDGYLAYLTERGFKESTKYGHLKDITAFGEYLLGKGVDTANGVDEPVVEEFVADYLSIPRKCGPPRSCRRSAEWIGETLRGSLRRFLGYLRNTGVLPKPGVPVRTTPYDKAFEDYVSFLRDHRGFAEITLAQHRRIAESFFARLADRRPPVLLSGLTARDVEDVALALSDGLGVRCHQILMTTLESLIRHLRSAGRVPAHCAPFLPRRRSYALAALPSKIPWDDIVQAIESVDRSTAMGRRNYALLQVLSVSALRASEIAALTLEDFSWRAGILRVRQTKTHRILELPLVPRVVDAVVDYLRHGRPESVLRQVFLKRNAPSGPISRAIVYDVARKTLLAAGIEAAHYGPHIVRHARATALLRSGNSLKAIGDLLGHRIPEATSIYCKLAVDDLREVALELPEVTP